MMKGKSGGVGGAAGVGGEASHDRFLEKRLMIFSQRLGISNEALIQPYEYMKSFKAITGMLLSFFKKRWT